MVQKKAQMMPQDMALPQDIIQQPILVKHASKGKDKSEKVQTKGAKKKTKRKQQKKKKQMKRQKTQNSDRKKRQ